jgi:hypothetical protein
MKSLPWRINYTGLEGFGVREFLDIGQEPRHIKQDAAVHHVRRQRVRQEELQLPVKVFVIILRVIESSGITGSATKQENGTENASFKGLADPDSPRGRGSVDAHKIESEHQQI